MRVQFKENVKNNKFNIGEIMKFLKKLDQNPRKKLEEKNIPAKPRGIYILRFHACNQIKFLKRIRCLN